MCGKRRELIEENNFMKYRRCFWRILNVDFIVGYDKVDRGKLKF